MTPQAGWNIAITITILIDISKSKNNQTMKLGQLRIYEK